MKKILGCIRRADERFGLIETGDKIAVGVSGGKDSMVMLLALEYYRKYFSRKDFSITAVTLKVFDAFDVSPIADFCDRNEIEYVCEPTNIGRVVFEDRNEKNPCSLCARMRRGTLSAVSKRIGCNKIALGHTQQDVLHTFLLSAFFEARLNVFAPKTYLDRSDITVIRPLVYADERDVISLMKKFDVPTVKNPCPVCGKTQRAEIKKLVATIQESVPNAQEMLFSAIAHSERYHLWD